MRILYSTHGISLKLFSSINKNLIDDRFVSDSAFIVSNKFFYEKSFLKDNEFFEKKFFILKEWDIYKEFKNNNENIDIEFLREVEKEYESDLNLIDTIISDRRIFCGKNSSFFQDYTRKYSDKDLYNLIGIYFKTIRTFIEKFKPDLFVNFLPVNLFDCISYLICKKKNVKILSLRSSKIDNGVFFSRSFFDPSPELAKKYNELIHLEKNSIQSVKYFDEYTNKKENLYEGAVRPSNKPALNIKFLNYFNFLKNFLNNFKNNLDFDDPQKVNYLKSNFYNGFYNKFNAMINNFILKKNFAKTQNLIKEKKFKFCFFPMHTEPEVSLLTYSKPYLNQIELIRQVAMSLPIDFVLIVKEHPWSVGKRKISYYKKILNIPRVYLVPSNLTAKNCINYSDLVITISSSVGQEAVFSKIPVLTFGKTSINLLSNNMVQQIDNHTDLKNKIKSLLNKYSFSKKEVLSFIDANMQISVNVDLYTKLLEKKNSIEFNKNLYEKDIKNLSDHLKTLV